IQAAMVQRLETGLGKAVRTCDYYAGEIDDLENAVKAFPAAYVAFGGMADGDQRHLGKPDWKETGTFVVVVGDRLVRRSQGLRVGAGQATGDVGVNRLVWAVRRLLAGQKLGLTIARLKPGKVKTLASGKFADNSWCVMSVEFKTSWEETALPDGSWPAPEDPDHPDALFPILGGKTEAPLPWLSGFDVGLYQPGKDTPSLTFETHINNEETPS
ncbi:MAG TPA: phage protein Gp37, partial [Telluria sp.]|nr:phage protein Gp37 [Telluria sp.]